MTGQHQSASYRSNSSSLSPESTPTTYFSTGYDYWLISYRNVCDCEPYPLLKTINRVLGRLPGPGPDCYLDEQRNDLDGVVIENSEIGFTEGMGRDQCVEPLLRGHSTDCNKYVICEFGTLLEQSCPSQLHFNKVTKDFDNIYTQKYEYTSVHGVSRSFTQHDYTLFNT